MALVRPFKGYLYNSVEINGAFGSVCAPPYDVISPAMQDEFHGRSRYNVVRLILARSELSDTGTQNKYTRAGELLKEWVAHGILTQDRDEAFYVYRQDYEAEGKICRRIGFLGKMKIEDPEEKGVLPHEKTHSKPKEDRLCLIKEVKGNLSPVFGLYLDREGITSEPIDKVMLKEPVINFEEKGERHRLWRVTDRADISKISDFLKDKKIFIADGHHRYEVARNYRDIMRQTPGYDGRADYIMTYFTGMDNEDKSNLTILATHRVIDNFDYNSTVISRMERIFTAKKHGSLRRLTAYLGGELGHIFGFYSNGDYYSFELGKSVKPEELIKCENSPDWKKLDVSILHNLILGDILKINPSENTIHYFIKPEEAVDFAAEKRTRCAFLLNPTKIGELRRVAENGEVMPQKSTYFYPKLLTGLVFNIY
ncbi:MAG: DUF1015 domain-containing protein [Candidatus Omnitrophica bacterium]|nr:DUF1015 domain-containing protein [Candidatus Omnitrophota bacterium]